MPLSSFLQIVLMVHPECFPHFALNLNGLLVTRQIDNTSPGVCVCGGGGEVEGMGGVVPGGKLVPGSHKRCELAHQTC